MARALVPSDFGQKAGGSLLTKLQRIVWLIPSELAVRDLPTGHVRLQSLTRRMKSGHRKSASRSPCEGLPSERLFWCQASVATEQRNPYFPLVTQDDYPSADIFRRVADHAGIRVVARPPAYSVSLSARHDLAARLSSKIPKKINCGSLKFLLDSNGSPLTRSRTLLKESS